jgi:hypothetical protein
MVASSMAAAWYHAAMNRLIVFIAAWALVCAGCGLMSSAPEKQWYKPNVDYTAADFERDRVECTDKKTKALAEDCMRQLGWASLGVDIGPAVKAPDPAKAPNSKSRY